MAPDNTPAVEKALAGLTPTAGEPEAATLSFAQDNTPAVDKTVAGAAQDNTAPGAVDLTTPTTPNNVAAQPIGEPPASLLNMPSTFTPAFVELAAGGNSLNTLNASPADIGKVVQGTVGGQLKSYQVRAGTDAQDLPGLVRPANFNDPANAVVFVQL